jgi:FlaA1/EpsC-like NDP-sugar epimerase
VLKVLLDMGQPVRILDLATTLIRLSGKSAEDVRIRFAGLRPGEKSCEERFHANELVTPTCHPKIRTREDRGTVGLHWKFN